MSDNAVAITNLKLTKSEKISLLEGEVVIESSYCNNPHRSIKIMMS